MTSIDEALRICGEGIRGGDECLAIYLPKEIVALSTDLDKTSRDVAAQSGVKVVTLGNSGGCIVAFPGNIELGHFSKDLEGTFLSRMAEEVKEHMRRKGLDASLDNNDILIDGMYKVFSTSKAIYNNTVLFGAVHISINCDADLVRKICTKEMKKIPKGLSDYGITTEEMLNLVLRVYEESDNVL